MKQILSVICVVPILISYASMGIAQNVNERYPFRMPDWLWDTPATAHLLTPEEVLALRVDIARLAQLENTSNSLAAENLGNDIAKRISSQFTIRDMARGAYIANHQQSGVALAVQIDPTFDATSQGTIKRAVSRLVEVALDPTVIQRAFERSTTTPGPMPPQFEVENGKPKVDPIGRHILTSDYRSYLRYRVRPMTAELFTAELRNALADASLEPAVLVISRYSGNDWWGGATHNYYINPVQHVGRESPARGYFYIRLNSDKFSKDQAGWNDPDLWASKIGHELLHNIGYWHPTYKDLSERDAHNKGENNWSFLVAYEDAILQRLQEPK
jgi:hypothetical protein